MIITAVSHVGDFLRVMPSLWNHHKTTGEKYVFMFTSNYKPYTVIEELLRLQSFTEDVVYVDVGTNAFNPHDYLINPSVFDSKYLNRPYINLNLDFSLTQPIANYYGTILGGYSPDYTFRFQLPNPQKRHKKYHRDVVGVEDLNKGSLWKSFVPNDIVVKCLPLTNSLIDNVLYAKCAGGVHTPSNLFAHVLEFCDVDMVIYFHSHLNPRLLHNSSKIVVVHE